MVRGGIVSYKATYCKYCTRLVQFMNRIRSWVLALDFYSDEICNGAKHACDEQKSALRSRRERVAVCVRLMTRVIAASINLLRGKWLFCTRARGEQATEARPGAARDLRADSRLVHSDAGSFFGAVTSRASSND